MKTTVSLQKTQKHSISASIKSWLNRGNGLYSLIMDDYITNRQALLITNVLASLSLILSLANSHPLVVLVLAGWLAISVDLCKKGGLK